MYTREALIHPPYTCSSPVSTSGRRREPPTIRSKVRVHVRVHVHVVVISEYKQDLKDDRDSLYWALIWRWPKLSEHLCKANLMIVRMFKQAFCTPRESPLSVYALTLPQKFLKHSKIAFSFYWLGMTNYRKNWLTIDFDLGSQVSQKYAPALNTVQIISKKKKDIKWISCLVRLQRKVIL